MIGSLPLSAPELESRIIPALQTIEDRLMEVVTSADETINPPTSHLAEAGGKRLRPVLALLTAQLGDPALATGEEIRDAGVAVELTHIATLYHDDVMDEAPLRRGAPSAQTVWGNSAAILTGDVLVARASQLVAALSPEAVMAHAKTFERLCMGQLHETLPRPAGTDPVDHYIQVLADKTGSLIAVSARYGAGLAGWMLAVGLSVLFLAQGQVCSYWLTRHRRFQAIASSSVVRSLGIAALQLACGFVASGGLGAAIGATLAGQGIAVAYLSWRSRDARLAEASDPSLCAVAARYRKMALVGVPNVVVDALRTSAIPMLIASFSVASLGQFNMAWMALQAPVALIAGALSQVYLPRLSDTPPGQMSAVVRRVGGAALGFSIPVFALLAWVSPWLFPLVFGARWEAAGYFARSLAPWLALTVATSPLSNVFVATYHQRRMLAFACVYCAAPLAWLWLSPYGIETTVAVLGALMALLLVGMLAMAVLTARAYDRGEGVRPEVV